ncbi:hypothetical protein [Micromonospora sagamiensis]|uniref:Uncharacterized protein n=1 Tax=Micromonospora sagamiensis TaxID=47875 RepID=A0A562W8Z1_9ACTN|nr:hypothetical protein [Micromonospora sagamiensis]TWJ26763.1 hypothetical protein JD81_00226 [Micromonospora sagamiensis]BCL14349.1 hypothetical protein GCM10017556_20880 [Micromonospora sagamiensis]
MDSHVEGRSGWLVGLTVVALLAGAGWWTAADPRATPGAALAPRADVVMRAAAASGASATPPAPPLIGDGRTLLVEPSTGRTVDLSGGRTGPASGSRVAIDPSSGRVLGVTPGDPGAGASRLGTVLWRETRLLTDNVRELRRQAHGAPGTRYQLLVICDGEGDLLVRLGSGRLWNGRRVSGCDGTLHSIGVTGTDAPLSVRITHPQEGAVELTTMLVALD